MVEDVDVKTGVVSMNRTWYRGSIDEGKIDRAKRARYVTEELAAELVKIAGKSGTSVLITYCFLGWLSLFEKAS
jgi:hypothetical protein